MQAGQGWVRCGWVVAAFGWCVGSVSAMGGVYTGTIPSLKEGKAK